ncbi:2'-5' RNA ligase family protein [Lentzea flava]|uniref:RNA 2',3'-cyclic phosphodiesterase n=1 Tax=Lentzea flava TaxID=103732 RepID=A0ABQ2UJT9_9PSEU|nr:2'-5' RNA ligase family protein [Lentzea flava]MCP2199526.1 2'-5' RNA ligase [Lentzea flava]GGU37482.1 RNA 2',3'-cyclic phosphodiesterase [Lentzea flava]
MKYFTALFPPQHVVDELKAVLDRTHDLEWTKPEKWHITLCFHGETADEGRFAALEGHEVPQLRLKDFGDFRGRILWAGIDGDLNQLARAAGADDNWRAHLTVAYGYRGQPMPAFESSPWQPSEAVLVSSADGVYTPVARVGLRTSARR